MGLYGWVYEARVGKEWHGEAEGPVVLALPVRAIWTCGMDGLGDGEVEGGHLYGGR